ncbi:MAG: hypothetical protein JOY92_09345 [Verrucomicrobia bacterium]|nr:hypothetical protein [Verrucomicrobiota bacterium]
MIVSHPPPSPARADVGSPRSGPALRPGAWTCFAGLILVAGLILRADAGQSEMQPVGQLTITTPEGSATFTGPDPDSGSKPLLQCRAGYRYSVDSFCHAPRGGKFDEHGAVGVERYYSIRHGGNLYDAPVQVPVSSKDRPASSGLGGTRSYGPYTAADYLSQSSTGSAAYLRETIILGYYNKHSGTRAAILACGNVDVFPPAVPSVQSLTSFSTQVQFTNVLTNQALNNSNPSGDPPIVQATLSNLYPGGASYLRIYPGTQTSSPANVTAIPNTAATAPMGDISGRTLVIPIGPYLNQPGFYTIEAVQQVPAYGTDPVLQNTATFNASLGFAVHAEVGTVVH